MPLYEYQCDACGHRFEHIQKFSDPLLTVCPKCEGALHKLVSSPAFQFKGTGWYVTDYARKGSGAEADEGSDGKDGKAAEDGKAAKSETSDKSAKTDAKSGSSTSSSDSSKTQSKSSTNSSSS